MPEHQRIQQSKKPDTIFQKQANLVSQNPVSNPYSIIQRAKINPKSLTHDDVMQLQRTIGNRAVAQLLSGIINSSTTQQETVQRQEIPEEEEPLQGKIIEPIQRQEMPEEEEPLQGKMAKTIQLQEIPEEEEPLKGRFAEPIQCQEIPEEEKPLQGKMIEPLQLQEIPEEEEPLQGKFESIQYQEIPEEEPLQTKRENNTGMPDNLKAGVENLSGINMSDVRVHYNSDKPAKVGALAYTQGTDIHVAPGQERHLPHEAWHVVQQKQDRVKPTIQLKDGVPINDDKGLEHEADVIGERAHQMMGIHPATTGPSGEVANRENLGKAHLNFIYATAMSGVVQRKAYIGEDFAKPKYPMKLEVETLYNDDIVRRFKDQQELEKFATNGSIEGAGALQYNNKWTWVRLPPSMLVLGETHSAQIGPDIIKATSIKKFRYEGYTHRSPTRLRVSPQLSEYFQTADEKRLEPTHDAEHALPKYARVIPDIIIISKLQNDDLKEDALKEMRKSVHLDEKSIEEIRTSSSVGAEFKKNYSLVMTLIKTFFEALIYCKSYDGKFWHHSLTEFYETNQNSVDEAIEEIKANENTVPNFNKLKITPLLGTMAKAYETVAKDKVGLGSEKKMKRFKHSLNLCDEMRVSISVGGEQNDYLRDASMFKTIKEAKNAGYRLFVIGDAHRLKLQPLIKGLGLQVMEDKEFLQDQINLNIEAEEQITKADHEMQGEIKERKDLEPDPKPTEIGQTFTLPVIPYCSWKTNETVEPTGELGKYKITGDYKKNPFGVPVKLELIWTKGKFSKTLKVIKLNISN